MAKKRFTGIFISLLWRARCLLGFLLFLIVAGGVVFRFDGLKNGNDDLWLSLYTAFITALTIGYGDMTPVGPFGRVTAVILGFDGIILLGAVVAACIKALERSDP